MSNTNEITKSKPILQNTICVHTGEVSDTQFGGAVSPLFLSTSYPYAQVDEKRYPRYLNSPNPHSLAKKVAALENAEDALMLSSGMAAISNTLLALLKPGDHLILQNQLYGGTAHFITSELRDLNIAFDFTEDLDINSFEKLLKPNTKAIYIESPSNPLLKLVDIAKVANFAKAHQLTSIIDNTFATPINQKPIVLGIDIVLHSATKYFGGHSDITAGAVAGKKYDIDLIKHKAINLGGSLADFTAWLLERSMKTLSLRVKQQNRNAKALAGFLNNHPKINQVNYPGLSSHPDHELAVKQMQGFGGMMSFELKEGVNVQVFLSKLNIIKDSMSLAGVESTILLPSETSHSLLSAEQRSQQGISDHLLRFSCGIEDYEDLIKDIDHALD
jgi:cystathionine beta-lyase